AAAPSSEEQSTPRGRSRQFLASLGFVNELSFDLDLHLLGDEHTSCFESLVPSQTEVFSIDLASQAEAYAHHAPRILSWPLVFSLEGDTLGGFTDGEVAGDLDVGTAHLDARALEGDVWMVLCVEEIRRSEVPVALRLSGVNSFGSYLRFYLGGAEVVGVEFDLSFHSREAAAHRADHHVPY